MAYNPVISLFFLIVGIGILGVVGFVAYGIAQGVSNTTRQKMEKKNLTFSKEGMKVGVKEVSQESEQDQSRRCVLLLGQSHFASKVLIVSVLVNVWNHTSFPAYKSRLWNMAGSSEDKGKVERRKP